MACDRRGVHKGRRGGALPKAAQQAAGRRGGGKVVAVEGDKGGEVELAIGRGGTDNVGWEASIVKCEQRRHAGGGAAVEATAMSTPEATTEDAAVDAAATNAKLAVLALVPLAALLA